MRLFIAYLRQRRKGIFVFFLFCLIFGLAFRLYHLPVEAVFYPAAVSSLLGAIFLTVDFQKVYRKHHELLFLQKLPAEMLEDFPEETTMEDGDYQKIIFHLKEEQADLKNKMDSRYADMVNYYTIWAHQIKTPIASMRLTLQNEDSEFSRRIKEDLFRVEQYVEMVLTYVRLDSDSTDYVISEYDLDGIVKQAVKKFSSQFYRRKLHLEYEPLKVKVLTDEKWLSFVLEQILSNSLKYTPPEGTIAIRLEGAKTLCIWDTGIGIAPEDLPRIFEKGYTGYNGRSDKKASGIGLYLCRRILKNLGHELTVQSALDCGTVVRINLEENRLEVE